jgi:hypothetical protein
MVRSGVAALCSGVSHSYYHNKYSIYYCAEKIKS